MLHALELLLERLDLLVIEASDSTLPACPELPTYSAPVMPPALLSRRAASSCPERRASSSGVLPHRSCGESLALSSLISVLITSRWPSLAARCIAVRAS